jgi:hypothetical protein
MNTKASYIQALQGNMAEARYLMDQAVEDATYETKFKLDAINVMMTQNNALINRLDSRYQNAMNQAFELAKYKYEEDKADKNFAGEMALRYNSIGANIKVTDSRDDVYRKVAAAGGELAYLNKSEAIKNAYEGGRVGGTDGSTKVTLSDGTVTTKLDRDAQSFLDGVIDDASFGNSAAELAYLRQVRQRANELATIALQTTPSTTKATTYTPKQPTAYSVGQDFARDMAPLVQGPTSLAKGVANTVGSFFSGLFGR